MATQTGSIDFTTSNSVKLAAEAGWQSDLDSYYTKSEIDVTVGGINSTVSTKVGEDEVISSINQSSESVSINANKINLSGAVTISDLATDASTALADAAETATSYVTEITGQNGIMVHPSTDDDTGVQITSDVDILRDGHSVLNVGTQGDTSGNTDAGVTIYDGTTSQNVVAKFDSDEVSLGANSTSSTIDMCGGAFKFDVDTSDPNNEAATIWLDQDAVDPSTSSAPVLRILSGTSSVGRGIVIRGTVAAQWPISIVNYSGSTTTEQVGLGSLGVLTPNIKFSGSGMGTIDAYNGILVTTSIGSNTWSTPAGTVLWSGAYHMTASHTATLAHNVSTCPTGIVLHWQAYVNGSAANQDQLYCFVPKSHVANFAGGGVQMPLMTSGFGNVGCKYVYVYDDRVTGAANNNQSGTGSSITYNNAYWVLTQIIAV